jgi:hypothetical protein
MSRRTAAALLATVLAVAVAEAPAAAQSAAELVAKADEVTAKVVALRGLKKKREFKRGVMNKEQILARLKQRMAQEYSPAEIAAEELAMKRLGLIPRDARYLEIVLALLTDQIAGFYDPWARELYIADWSSFGGDMLMAHEIGHALQDQHFDLKTFMLAEKKNADATVARQALVEGDGTAVMMEYMLGGTLDWSDPAVAGQLAAMSAMAGGMEGVPLALREALIFPYTAGAVFVGHIRAKHPWRAVDAIYKKPPRSSEQILHPEKYEAGEAPIAVRAAMPATLRGYTAVFDNVSGELGLQLLLRQHGVADDVARTAAAGWGGDRLVVWSPADRPDQVDAAIAADYIVMDSEADARELMAALTIAMPKLAGGRPVVRKADRVVWKTASGSVAVAERRGDSVVLVVGAPPARADELVAQIWTGFRRGP